MSQKDWIEKDYYKALGVPKDASQADIKKAFRTLAKKYHPDSNENDPKAEARFKEVSEAYDVLSDEGKRKEYDEARSLFGSGGFRPPGGFGGQRGRPAARRSFDLNDLFSRMNTAGRGRRSAAVAASATCSAGSSTAAAVGGAARAPRRGADVESAVTLSFDEALRGRHPAAAAHERGPVHGVRGHRRAQRHHAAGVPHLPGRRPGQPQRRAASRSPSRAASAAVAGSSSTTRARPAAAAATRRRPAPCRRASPPACKNGQQIRLRGKGARGRERRRGGRPARRGHRHAAPGVRPRRRQPHRHRARHVRRGRARRRRRRPGARRAAPSRCACPRARRAGACCACAARA